MWTTTKMLKVSFTQGQHHAERIYRYTDEEIAAAHQAMNEGVSRRLPMMMVDIEVIEFFSDPLQIP